VVTKLRKQMFVRQFVTDEVLIPPDGKQKIHLTMYLFSVKLLLFARRVCETFQWAARRKKWRMFWNHQKRKQNKMSAAVRILIRSCVSLVPVIQVRSQWL
jgi:hypothetical protein